MRSPRGASHRPASASTPAAAVTPRRSPPTPRNSRAVAASHPPVGGERYPLPRSYASLSSLTERHPSLAKLLRWTRRKPRVRRTKKVPPNDRRPTLAPGQLRGNRSAHRAPEVARPAVLAEGRSDRRHRRHALLWPALRARPLPQG